MPFIYFVKLIICFLIDHIIDQIPCILMLLKGGLGLILLYIIINLLYKSIMLDINSFYI